MLLWEGAVIRPAVSNGPAEDGEEQDAGVECDTGDMNPWACSPRESGRHAQVRPDWTQSAWQWVPEAQRNVKALQSFLKMFELVQQAMRPFFMRDVCSWN